MSLQAPIPVQQPQPGEQLLDLACGYVISAAMNVAAKLKVADLLTAGPRPIAELAKATGVREDGLYRVMRTLASVGVFSEVGLRYFALTPKAEPLRSDVPNSIRDLVLWVCDPFHFHTWKEMMHCVQTGQTAVEHLYRKPVFQVLEDDREESGVFNAGMTGFCNLVSSAVLDAYDFSGVGSLMDVAGGHGLMLASILKAYPRMHGFLFELNHVAEGAREHFRKLELAGRCQVVTGDFFAKIPAGAEVYVMQHIIHDWEDDKAVQILNNVRRALAGNSKGRLLLLEGVIAPGNQTDFTKLVDLEMLIMCGGRERSEQEFGQLFKRSGFRLNRVVRTQGPICVIEAMPV